MTPPLSISARPVLRRRLVELPLDVFPFDWDMDEYLVDTFSLARRIDAAAPRTLYSTTRDGISLTRDDRGAHLPEASIRSPRSLARRTDAGARALCTLRFVLIEMNIHACAETFGTFAVTVAFPASGRTGMILKFSSQRDDLNLG